MKIRAHTETFEFQRAIELPKPLPFDTIEDASKWLRNLWWQDSALLSKLKSYLAQSSWEEPESFRLSDYDILQRLASLLYSRSIVVFRTQEPVSAGAPSKKEDSPAPAFPLSERRQRPPSAIKLSKTWISIVLKDSTGKPMAGEKYQIELPDGQIKVGTLDSMGTAGVSGIDPGQCKVSFPRLAGATWGLAGNKANNN